MLPEEIRECYRRLKLKPGDDAAKIRVAYRRMLMIWHSDRFPKDDAYLQGLAHAETIALIEAYEKLVAYLSATSGSSRPGASTFADEQEAGRRRHEARRGAYEEEQRGPREAASATEEHGEAARSARPPPPGREGFSPSPAGETTASADVERNKVFAVLAYLGILFLIPLLAAKESRFARYHTNQGMVLFLTAILCWFGAAILSLVSSFIPIIKFIGCLIWPAAYIGILVLMVLGIINAAKGECKPLPFIGQFKLIK